MFEGTQTGMYLSLDSVRTDVGLPVPVPVGAWPVGAEMRPWCASSLEVTSLAVRDSLLIMHWSIELAPHPLGACQRRFGSRWGEQLLDCAEEGSSGASSSMFRERRK